MKKTEIIKIKGDWKEVVDDCRATVGKENLGREPSKQFKRSILISEHSPIRDIIVKWRWKDMPHWVTVHYVRHKWEKFVRSQRSDRTGIDRTKLSQDEPQTFIGEANSQHLIDTMRKRLCFMASPETRKYAEDLKYVLHVVEPELSDVLVPNCIYRCGCPEMNGCEWYENAVAKHPELQSIDIKARYEAYNNLFKNRMNSTEEE
jgi:hypothetical protein